MPLMIVKSGELKRKRKRKKEKLIENFIWVDHQEDCKKR